MFVEYGSDRPLDKIASRSRVGNSTVHRHFSGHPEPFRRLNLVVRSGTDQAELSGLEESGELRRFATGFDKARPELLPARDRLELCRAAAFAL